MHWEKNLLVSLLLINGLLGLVRPVAHASERNLPAPTDHECDAANVTVANGARPTPWQLYRDAYCIERFTRKVAPHGMVVVFGSARINSGEAYERTKEFARRWTEKKTPWPIATGGGQGLMKAANEGAAEAKGVSLGMGTQFGNPETPEKPNDFVTKGYFFTFYSFSQRETEMIDRASAVVVVTGGIGTEWEIMETITKIQTQKKSRIPVILLGPVEDWKELIARLGKMVDRKTIREEDLKLFRIAETAEEAVKLITPPSFDPAATHER